MVERRNHKKKRVDSEFFKKKYNNMIMNMNVSDHRPMAE